MRTGAQGDVGALTVAEGRGRGGTGPSLRDLPVNDQAEALYRATLCDPLGRPPYAAYRRLREVAPRLRTADGALILSTYRDCAEALHHRGLGKGEFQPSAGSPNGTVARRAGAGEDSFTPPSGLLAFVNPPDHTRLRRLASVAFQDLPRLRAAITSFVDALLAELPANGDFVATVAEPLPALATGELLGVPAGDVAEVRALSRSAFTLLTPNLLGHDPAGAVAAWRGLSRYFAALLRDGSRRRGDTGLGRMAARGVQDGIDDADVATTATVLSVAGYQTTANLLGNGLHSLLGSPDQLRALRADPALTPQAVDEMLRHDAPVHTVPGETLRRTTLAGLVLEAGEQVICLIGAANRDPDRYRDPDRFDIRRRAGAHLAFAAGPHYCIGAHLARLQAEIVFTRLLATYHDIELAGAPVGHPGTTIHGLRELPVDVA
ncbi:cytochrome P450 [Kitasatospora sp. LaBMicrA B282]|uniref:cytochrome P450 n=1 Tax=Kitasatospora sp. LaBMicrA B282 TaxID=3420949 RepID=UPI003D0FC39A